MSHDNDSSGPGTGDYKCELYGQPVDLIIPRLRRYHDANPAIRDSFRNRHPRDWEVRFERYITDEAAWLSGADPAFIARARDPVFQEDLRRMAQDLDNCG
jgi:hypothetical protein